MVEVNRFLLFEKKTNLYSSNMAVTKKFIFW